MKLIDVLRLAFGNLRRNKMRTFLTIIGVVIGIGAIVFLVSLGFGLQKMATSKITSLDALTVINVTKPENRFTKDATSQFATLPGVEGVSVTYSLPAKAKLKEDKSAQEGSESIVYGVDPKFLKLEEVGVSLGKENFSSNTAEEAIVSKANLRIFEISDAKDILGKEIKFKVGVTKNNVVDWNIPNNEKTYKIIGVTNEDQNAVAYVPISNLENLPIPNYNSIKVKIAQDQKTEISKTKAKIEQLGFETSSIKDTLDQINRVFLIIKIILGGFGMIALFVASIGIFNTMTISLLERTHEIGIMKAIGATDKDVKRTFLTEAAAIGFFGGLFGVLFGLLAGFLINALMNLLATSFGGQPLKIFETPLIFGAEAVLFSFLVSLIAGIYPARRASRLNPIEALRYE